jgi:hypothetical protein
MKNGGIQMGHRLLRLGTLTTILIATLTISACGTPPEQAHQSDTSNVAETQSDPQLQNDKKTYVQAIQPTVNDALRTYSQFLNVTLQYDEHQMSRSVYFYNVHNCSDNILSNASEVHNLQVSSDVQNYNALLLTSMNNLYEALQQAYEDQAESPDPNAQEENSDIKSFTTGIKQFENDVNASPDPNVISQINQTVQELNQQIQKQN